MRVTKVIPQRTVKQSNAARDQRRAEARQRVCKWNGHIYLAKNSRGDYCPDHAPEKRRSSALGKPSLFVGVDGEGMTGGCLADECSCTLFVHVCNGSIEVCEMCGHHDICMCGHRKYGNDWADDNQHGHIYVLFGVGKAQLWHKDASELQWWEIFDFMYRQFLLYPRRAAFVGFFLGYDFGQWLKGLLWDRASALLMTDDKNYIKRRKTNPNRRGGNNEPFPIQLTPPDYMRCPIAIRDGGDRWQWQIDMMGNNKRFKLRPQPCACDKQSNCQHVRGVPYMYICDTAPFFQRSFMSVINPANWDVPIVSDEEWNVLNEGKARRDHAVLDDEMRYYNALENDVLARVMTRLDEGFRATGVELSKKQWFGPGQPAGVWLNSRAPKRKDLWPSLPKGLMDAAQCTYIAGWWDIFAHGHMPEITHLYDINSAYPYQIVQLPCLGKYEDGKWVRHGEWEHRTYSLDKPYDARRIPRMKGGICMVHALVSGSNPHIGTMLHREKTGYICRPHMTAGWFWLDELHTAMDAKLIDDAWIIEAWVYFSDCSCLPPLREVADMYEQRLKVGKDTPLGIGAKLNYNSQSGKFAQTVGENPPFLNWIYASRITSGCRTQILEAIATHPSGNGARNALMIATDAVMFLDEHTGLPISPRLGDWSYKAKKNVTLAKPGFWWDQSARDALAEGKSPGVKSRGISASAFATAMTEVDRQFDNWRGPNPDGTGWPEITLRLGFAMLTPKQALRQNKWEYAGRISTPEVTLSMSSNMLVKRDPGWFDDEYGIYRSVPKVRNTDDHISYPYNPKKGPAQSEASGITDGDAVGITDDGSWASQIAEAFQLKG